VVHWIHSHVLSGFAISQTWRRTFAFRLCKSFYDRRRLISPSLSSSCSGSGCRCATASTSSSAGVGSDTGASTNASASTSTSSGACAAAAAARALIDQRLYDKKERNDHETHNENGAQGPDPSLGSLLSRRLLFFKVIIVETRVCHAWTFKIAKSVFYSSALVHVMKWHHAGTGATIDSYSGISSFHTLSSLPSASVKIMVLQMSSKSQVTTSKQTQESSSLLEMSEERKGGGTDSDWQACAVNNQYDYSCAGLNDPDKYTWDWRVQQCVLKTSPAGKLILAYQRRMAVHTNQARKIVQDANERAGQRYEPSISIGTTTEELDEMSNLLTHIAHDEVLLQQVLCLLDLRQLIELEDLFEGLYDTLHKQY
jgi:hypothetical protein